MKYRPPICGCKPLPVSGLIKLGRWGLLIAGIQKGIEKKAMYSKEAEEIREQQRQEAEIMAPIIAAEKLRIQHHENKAFNDWIREQSGHKHHHHHHHHEPVEGEAPAEGGSAEGGDAEGGGEEEDEDDDDDWDDEDDDEDDEEGGGDGEHQEGENVEHQEGDSKPVPHEISFSRSMTYIRNRKKLNYIYNEVLEKCGPLFDEDDNNDDAPLNEIVAEIKEPVALTSNTEEPVKPGTSTQDQKPPETDAVPSAKKTAP